MPAKSTFGSASVIPFSNTQTSYNIQRSLRFNSADLAHLSRTPDSAGNRKTWTWSGWIKKSGSANSNYVFNTGTDGTNPHGYLYFSGDLLAYWDRRQAGDGIVLQTNAVFRDPSSWYHIVLAVDTTQATNTNRAKLYVNGSEVTSFGIANYPNQNEDSYFNRAAEHRIGGITSNFFNGYLAEINFIDGQALTPSSFGYTDPSTDVWMPKKYAGTYGTNGFYLNFSDNSSLTTSSNVGIGKDFSGNSNYWATSGISINAGPDNDSLVDSPTNYGTDTGLGGEVRGNYATFSPIDVGGSTLTNGNLDISSGANQYRSSTINLPTKGKWYFEFTVNSLGATNTGFWIVTNQGGVFGLPVSGAYRILKDASDISVSGSGTPAAGHVMKVAYDADGGKIWFGRDTLWFSNAGNTTSDPNTNSNPSFSGLTPTTNDFIYINQAGGGAATCTGTINFGQRPFAYAAPSGFKALCTTNLPAPVIKKPQAHFDAITYNGTGTTFVSPSALAFAPDFVWAKSRSQEVSHVLSDTVRGAGEVLCTNNSRLSSSDSFITNFNQNGFTLNNSITANNSGSTYVAWNWKAGGPSATNTNTAYTILDESINGSLSNIEGSPTVVTLNNGNGLVIASVGGGNSDYFTFTVGNNQILNKIFLRGYSSYDNVAWLGIQSGSAWTAGNNQALMLAEQHFGPGNVNQEILGGAAPYNPGNYTVRVQQLGSNTNYTLEFQVSTPTPTNTAGSITSTVSVNALAGFSIVSFTAPNSASPQTVGHGLGVAPKFIITKSRGATGSWNTYHASIGATKYLFLNTNAAEVASASRWNDTSPTSSVFTLGSNFVPDASLTTYIAYCFAEVEGYSKFGSYTGNGSADGPFVFCGFRPRYLLIKNTFTAGCNWLTYDTARSQFNVVEAHTYADFAGREFSFPTDAWMTLRRLDILSNGFKIIGTDNNLNDSTRTHIFAAFAESPFKYARAR